MNINFTFSELLKSSIAKKHNILNIPDNIEYIDNMFNLIIYCLQPIRDYIKKPIIITSGFRNVELNKLVLGKSNSQHLYGQAADFYIKGTNVKSIIVLIKKSNIEYDQLINEYNKWIHISYVKNKNRKQYLEVN